jgi:hypothetical protein
MNLHELAIIKGPSFVMIYQIKGLVYKATVGFLLAFISWLNLEPLWVSLKYAVIWLTPYARVMLKTRLPLFENPEPLSSSHSPL